MVLREQVVGACVRARAIARVLVLENERCPRQIPSARPPRSALLEKNVAIERAPPARVLDFLDSNALPHACSDSFFFPPPQQSRLMRRKKNSKKQGL